MEQQAVGKYGKDSFHDYDAFSSSTSQYTLLFSMIDQIDQEKLQIEGPYCQITIGSENGQHPHPF